MATIIKPKRSGTASSVPTTSDLADGEMAVNSADQKIYIRSSSSIITLGTGTTATASELNILDGATISTAELNAAASAATTGKSIAMSIVFGSG